MRNDRLAAVYLPHIGVLDTQSHALNLIQSTSVRKSGQACGRSIRRPGARCVDAWSNIKAQYDGASMEADDHGPTAPRDPKEAGQQPMLRLWCAFPTMGMRIPIEKTFAPRLIALFRLLPNSVFSYV